MEIKKAKSLVSDMLDICGQLGDDTLNETCAGIYNDIQAAKAIETIINSARELMIFVGEAPWEEFEMSELKDEVENIFNQLIEEYEEF